MAYTKMEEMMEKSNDDNFDLLTIYEMAEILKISSSSAYKLAQFGEIPSIRINKSVRIRKSDLNSFIIKNISKL
jgi:excisionase family DNA binding protein